MMMMMMMGKGMDGVTNDKLPKLTRRKRLYPDLGVLLIHLRRDFKNYGPTRGTTIYRGTRLS